MENKAFMIRAGAHIFPLWATAAQKFGKYQSGYFNGTKSIKKKKPGTVEMWKLSLQE